CFACGKANPIGLRMEFFQDGEFYKSVWTPTENFQGYPGILHGGITCSLLDEIMGRFLYMEGLVAPTVELNVRYKTAVPIGQPVTLSSWVIERKKRLVIMGGRLTLEDGTVAAEADAKFIIAKGQGAFAEPQG
ncbi:MAG TPA: PaaI family thioesterase, partial [Bacillota bacterium]|nr:PaaI family thioesterase [Bacillota bacterium]